MSLLFLFALAPSYLNLELAYSSRVLLLLVPFALGCLYLVANRCSGNGRTQLLNGLAAICLLAASYQIAAQTHTSYQWDAYRRVFQRTLSAEGPRVIEFRDTALGHDYEGRVALGAQHWRWTLPMLNIVFAPGGQVRRYLYDARAVYQPYNLDHLPRLRNHGVRYFISNRVEPGELLGFNHAKLHLDDWYPARGDFRWARGGEADIRFMVAGRDQFSGTATLKMGVRGEQEVEIWLNGMLLMKQKLARTRESIELHIKPGLLRVDTENTLSFWFSNPLFAGERDRRILAGRFRSLQLH